MKSERDLRASERPADDQTDQIDDAESSADVGEHSRATNSDDLDAVAQRAPSTAARPASCLLTMFLTKSTTLNRMLMSTTAAEQPAATILTRRKTLHRARQRRQAAVCQFTVGNPIFDDHFMVIF